MIIILIRTTFGEGVHAQNSSIQSMAQQGTQVIKYSYTVYLPLLVNYYVWKVSILGPDSSFQIGKTSHAHAPILKVYVLILWRSRLSAV